MRALSTCAASPLQVREVVRLLSRREGHDLEGGIFLRNEHTPRTRRLGKRPRRRRATTLENEVRLLRLHPGGERASVRAALLCRVSGPVPCVGRKDRR